MAHDPVEWGGSSADAEDMRQADAEIAARERGYTPKRGYSDEFIEGFLEGWNAP